MQLAYQELHLRGIAHSVEVWQERQLVGGLYGLAMGRLFFGESMFLSLIHIFGRTEAHVASTQRQHPIRQLEQLQDALGVGGQAFQRLVGSGRIDDLHHLHLVELVLTDHAAGIAPGGTGLAAEARGMGDEDVYKRQVLVSLFFQISGLQLAISAGFVLFSSAMILYQTSAIIHGGERNYIMATISLYVSIYNLFISCLLYTSRCV